MSTAARSSAKAAVNSAGVSVAANRSVVARVNIASNKTGLSCGKPDERVGNSRHGVRAVDRAAARRGQRVGEFAESLDGDRGDDVFHAGEVLVEHRLAVFDLGGQPAGGDGVPALLLGQRASGGGDQLAAGGALARAAIFDGHAVMLAPIQKIAALLTRFASKG